MYRGVGESKSSCIAVIQMLYNMRQSVAIHAIKACRDRRGHGSHHGVKSLGTLARISCTIGVCVILIKSLDYETNVAFSSQ